MQILRQRRELPRAPKKTERQSVASTYVGHCIETVRDGHGLDERPGSANDSTK